MKNKAVIIHSVDDAEHCVQNKLYEGALLFSTHSSVDIYLKEIYNIPCQCLSKFFGNEEIKNLRNISSDTVDRILQALDVNVSPSINKQIDLRMRYFVPLYSYLGKYHYSGYINFSESIRKVVDLYKPEEIYFYNCKLSSFFDTDSDIDYVVSLLFRDIKTKILKYHRVSKNKFDRFEITRKRMKKIRQRPMHAIEKLLERISTNGKYGKLSKSRKSVLLFENLYHLEFLKGDLKKYNVLFYHADSSSPVGFDSKEQTREIEVDFKGFEFIEDIKNPLIMLFLKDIGKDFSTNIGKNIAAIDHLREIERDYPISLAIWGNPPIERRKALIFEYLRSRGVKILGAQHGCLYGEYFEPWHFDSDFNRCDFYISYGFTESNLKRLYTDREVDMKVFPLGAARKSPNNRPKKKIDILFPITNSMSFFDGGMTRIPLDKLAGRQIHLLEYLNSLEGFNIYIKPFPYSYTKKFTVLSVLRRMKNLKVVDHLSLSDFLESYSPGAVLIEYPSQPLFDVLHLDTEIFLMNDPVHHYEKQALKELEMRVHYAEDTTEIVHKLNLFLKGMLEKKRDDTYYKHYVYKEDSENNILRLIDGLIEGNV